MPCHSLLGLLIEFTNIQKVLTKNATGQINKYSDELWKDAGTTSMILLGGVKFSCCWSNMNNTLFCIGKK